MNALVILLCSTLLLYSPAAVCTVGSSSSSTNATDKQAAALLSFRSMVSDPSGALTWWNASNHPCRWRGVACGRGRHAGSVVALSLGSSSLSGLISPFLGNLSFLRVLDLGANQLVGQIPPELGRLGRLRELNLSGNSLEGGIPPALAIGCSKLESLSLDSNHLRGEIPGEIAALRNLAYLNLRANNLSGEIPPSLGNLSSLYFLNLGFNMLFGEIPASLGNLSQLNALGIQHNQLSGGIPSSLGHLNNLTSLLLQANGLIGSIPPNICNISFLKHFSVENNELSGMLPPNVFNTLPMLETFDAGENMFDGHIPSSLVNASKLSRFQIAENHFSGVIPPELGGLQGLKWFILTENDLEAKESNDWKFMKALTNCSQLEVLELEANKFSGTLPSVISNLSASLTILTLASNKIVGNMPREIGKLINLGALVAHNNFLTGSPPSSLGMLQNLRILWLDNNYFSGPFPRVICNLTHMDSLDLGRNNFSGSIPITVGNMVSLSSLRFSFNNFIGTIPTSLFNITTLSIYLDISYNHLDGSIPPEVGNLPNLVYLDARYNQLSGEIPITFEKCQLLQILYLQNNSFIGNIPSSFSEMKGLEILDLSSNNFSGQIPKFFGHFLTLYDLNLSYNNFDGEVPVFGVFANATGISVQGNNKLCGGIPDLHLPTCSLKISKRRHRVPGLAIVVPLVATTICILSLLLFFHAWYKNRLTKSPSTMSMRAHQLVSYQQLVHATDGFSTTNLLGTGSYGSVYRGKLFDETGENENLIAVKVLKLQTPGALKSFTAECEAMKNLRHRNLVKIVTACSSMDFNGNDFKAIVFDFMPNGCLEEWLHPQIDNQLEERHLNLVHRVGILFDVACALDYLHFHGTTPVVHCDLKPSNVLLDADMVAHVGDFGLAKILSSQPSTSSMGFRGTIGYAPPEYGAGNMVSTHGDIYSYGILVLEMITGRRPTDNTCEQGFSLRKCVEMALNNRAMDILDVELVTELENAPPATSMDGPSERVNSLISLLKLGLLCSGEMPLSRMSTKDIIKELLVIKRALA
ncbi:receptor kinase-like protein Xa21 isoform X1 [Oryza sativa Japonica Group]|jgi:receptor kinase-like protein|uniref:Receptor kinase-like protein Xa21 n=1 Tax=Oryza sativa subsp. japonica TaxID=39947 RepID=B9F195_ORYSJ|nr:receptor kinase-like protein Xa21 isoform X1 [Oryza sativa Japonica Group]EEE57437.1 hypothetical protein OsJ_07643 [Oryza sativa Japonica Group]KAF2946016.1 hypothetical protein DAI22_02g260300 [Oryza sativa Japonica Group]